MLNGAGSFLFAQTREINIPFYEREDKIGDLYFVFSFVFPVVSKGDPSMARKAKLERDFQAELIRELKAMFEDCVIVKLDPAYIQGIPDLLILWHDKWATLECKKSVRAKRRPNQEFYVGLMNKMSFSRFIYPENKKEVLHELQQAFHA